MATDDVTMTRSVMGGARSAVGIKEGCERLDARSTLSSQPTGQTDGSRNSFSHNNDGRRAGSQLGKFSAPRPPISTRISSNSVFLALMS